MTNKQLAFQNAAEGMIQNLQKRNMEGYFFEDSRACVQAVLSMIPQGSSVSWGGSETFVETGMKDALSSASGFTLIDRSTAKTPEEAREIYLQTVMSDYFFMSSNALTLNGELINIDGNSNRLACLLHGPRHVMILVGMNKIVTDVESGIQRVHNFAAPPNAVRLNTQTPCQFTGHCGDCLSPGCMCSHVVVTRRSRHEGRIKVFLIAQDLGY